MRSTRWAMFQSTLPVWGATLADLATWPIMAGFNPRSPCGERPRLLARMVFTSCFNPRSPCGERRVLHELGEQIKYVSIHAPRVGSDGQHPCPHCLNRRSFNPRSPCGERRVRRASSPRRRLFQSTLPVWGATTLPLESWTHLPFQSTLPVWGATVIEDHAIMAGPVSIHAPRVGSDRQQRSVLPDDRRFQSTLPVWGATGDTVHIGSGDQFQSTLPVWGATGHGRHPAPPARVSIHAPRVGSDITMPGASEGQWQFQSTLPVWGATLIRETSHPAFSRFNPRSPCGERHQ